LRRIGNVFPSALLRCFCARCRDGHAVDFRCAELSKLVPDWREVAVSARLLKIARLGHPVIRRGAEPLSEAELHSQDIQILIDDMVETMRDADGVGIAAPQVHVAKRIIVIEVPPLNSRYPGQPQVPLTIIINPEIASHSSETQEGWEGCLSVPELRGRVPRWSALKLSGLDRDGNRVDIEAEDFFARVIQHEVDHLNGRVFIDRLPDLSTLTHLREFQRYWVSPPSLNE
jgi:peptide deformylase